jgi:hypothetical protein
MIERFYFTENGKCLTCCPHDPKNEIMIGSYTCEKKCKYFIKFIDENNLECSHERT